MHASMSVIELRAQWDIALGCKCVPGRSHTDQIIFLVSYDTVDHRQRLRHVVFDSCVA